MIMITDFVIFSLFIVGLTMCQGETGQQKFGENFPLQEETNTNDDNSVNKTVSLSSTWQLDYCRDENLIWDPDFGKCLPKALIGDQCVSSVQCIVSQSTCSRKMCICIDYFVSYSPSSCNPIHSTAIEIYKITMIFASSCLALILLIFLACILRKSYCPGQSQLQGSGRSTIPDLFTIYPGTSGSPGDIFSSIPPTEKPPSYSETMRMINAEIGTPPPAYHNIFYNNNGVNNSNQPSLTVVNTTGQQSSNTINAQNSDFHLIAPSPTPPSLSTLSNARRASPPPTLSLAASQSTNRQGLINSAFSNES